MHGAVWEEDFGPSAEDFPVDSGRVDDVADRGRCCGKTKSFVEDGFQMGTMIYKILHVDVCRGCTDSWLCFALNGRVEARVEENVAQDPEAQFPGIAVDSMLCVSATLIL